MFNKIVDLIKENRYLKKVDISKRYLVVNKKMISRGVFIGLFIAMIPMPAQMLAVFAFTFIAKFNFPVAIAMCWVTNPLTMPFIYYLEYMTGQFLLGLDPIAVEITLEWFNTNFKNIMLPLYFGSLIYSILLSTIAYYGINLYWRDKKIRIR